MQDNEDESLAGSLFFDKMICGRLLLRLLISTNGGGNLACFYVVKKSRK